MKTKKIFLSVALLGLVFGMAACGGNQEGNKTSAGGSGDASQQSAQTSQQDKITVTAAEGKNKLLRDETVQLTAKVGDTVLEGVSWESSKPEIASVSNTGLVTALTKGSASIKAVKDGYRDGSVSISVDYPNITVTAAENKTSLLVGETVQLTSSEQGVTWESSDTTVAEVVDGLVTAKKLGQATISASKEFFNKGSVNISVVRPTENLKVDMTSGAAHYSADGWWELPSSGGYSFAMQQVDGPTPIAQNQSWGQQTDEPSDTFVGGFGIGDKETISFTSSLAEDSEIVLNIGNTSAAVLSSMMTIKLNNTPIDLTGIELEAHEGQYGMANLEFADISLGVHKLATPINTLEFEMLADNNLFLNEVTFYAGSSTMAVVTPEAKTPIAFTSTVVEVIEEETIQLSVDQTGVEFISLDETIATVDQTGLVTGVKMGKVNIRARKEGCYSAQVEITVNPKPVAGQIILEAEDAEGVSSDYNGGGYMVMTDGGMLGGSAVHSGGAYVTAWQSGEYSLTMKFQATEAKKMVLSVVGSAMVSFMGGESSAFNFATSATMTFNDEAFTPAAEAEFPVPEGYTATMIEVILGEVDVQVGENTLVFAVNGSAPSIDCFKLSEKTAA